MGALSQKPVPDLHLCWIRGGGIAARSCSPGQAIGSWARTPVSNAPMLRANERLGYVPVARSVAWQRVLEP